jgi:hypothetical protein
VTDASGRFEIENNHREKGLPVGEYRVTFFRDVDKNGKALPLNVKAAEVGGYQQIPEAYRKRKETPERATVTGQQGEFTFKIKGLKR